MPLRDNALERLSSAMDDRDAKLRGFVDVGHAYFKVRVFVVLLYFLILLSFVVVLYLRS